MDPVSIALIGGGVYLATKPKDPSAPTASQLAAVKPLPLGSGASKMPTAGTSGWSSLAGKLGTSLKSAAFNASANVKKNPILTARSSTFNNARPGGSVTAEAEKAVNAKAKAAYSALSSEAKKQSIDYLKGQYPNNPAIQAIPSSGNIDYDTVMKAAAAAGGTAACAATGAGVVVSPLCGIAATWIAGWAGPKFKEWGKDIYDGAGDALGKVGNYAEKAWDAVSFW